MPHYTLFHPDHEYLGQVLIDFENALGSNDIHQTFEKHGLINIDPQGWYPAQKFMDVLNDMEENEIAQMWDFVSIGLKQIEHAIVPPEFESLPLIQILQSLDATYHLNNRGTDIGEIKCEVVNENHVKLIFRVPQPEDAWYGVCYGYMRRFAPQDTIFRVYYDKNTPRRSEGGDKTVIHVVWELKNDAWTNTTATKS